MAVVTLAELLEAGVHFGHQSRRWNPKMFPYDMLDIKRQIICFTNSGTSFCSKIIKPDRHFLW